MCACDISQQSTKYFSNMWDVDILILLRSVLPHSFVTGKSMSFSTVGVLLPGLSFTSSYLFGLRSIVSTKTFG